MSDRVSNTGTAAASRARSCHAAKPILAIAAIALLAGCTLHKRDSVTVGAVPDDYRTNHPIVIAEKQEILDLPVGGSDHGVTALQRTSMEGFLANYDRAIAPALKIMAPVGATNDAAAARVAHGLASVARKNGVPGRSIVVTAYQAGSAEAPAPVRVTYVAVRAQTDKCGRWPEDILQTSENKHYANFGCSYQNNIAAQIANPGDLLGPRSQTEIDAANRSGVIGDYQQPPAGWEPTINY